MEARSRFTKVFDERVNSLIADGYCKRVDARLSYVWVARFQHVSNGNKIVLKGYPINGKIYQWTNGKNVHCETV